MCGAIGANGAVVGTMLHGLFENASIRRSLLRHLRGGDMAKPEAFPNGPTSPTREEYDRLAATVRQHVDMDMLLRIAKI